MPQSFFLVVVDVSGIQDYVFRTNDLQHHLGASELVRRATSEWIREALPSPHNIDNAKTPRGDKYIEPDFDKAMMLRDGKYIERDNLAAEVIYSGGGNAVILFADGAVAKTFVGRLSRQALLEAPGLNVTIVTRPFEWHESRSDLGVTVNDMLGTDLRVKKQHGQAGGEMLGLGVTADCEFTGLPAVTIGGEEKQRISSEIVAKRDYTQAANDRLKREIGGDNYVRDFDQFGSPGESSYVAVIHADGNGMGKRFERLASTKLSNRRYIQAMRALSRSVNAAAQAALKATTDAIRNTWQEGGKLAGVIPIRDGRLPFRPIIFGGDDATFVCDGRLGLTVAAKYLEEFAKQTLDEPEGKTQLTARAGIAIVKTHFPFGRAYRLAEELAKSAKEFTVQGTRSALDWHFGINGIVLDADDMRKRDYAATGPQHSSLLMRPLRLDESPTEWRNWPVFAQLVNALNNKSDYKPDYPANKIKAFREALRGGQKSAERFMAANFIDPQKPLPKVPNHNASNGWIGDCCAYFDPIEAMEFFVPLEGRREGGRA